MISLIFWKYQAESTLQYKPALSRDLEPESGIAENLASPQTIEVVLIFKRD